MSNLLSFYRHKIHYSRAYKERWGSHEWEWAHLNINLRVQIPPTYQGSFNYLVWDIVQRRNPKDLLVCRYFPRSFEIAQESDYSVVQIEQRDPGRLWGRAVWLRRRIWARLCRRWPVDPFLKDAASVIEQAGCRKVLLWDGIEALPALRQLLPDCTIAFSQRHYDYPMSISYYEYCDILITQTRGQTRHAFQRMRTLTPLVLSIPNGVELDLFSPVASSQQRNAIRAKLGLPNGRFIVIFPSKLATYKGTRYLQRWIEVTVKSQPDVFFLVVGKLHRGLPERHQQDLERVLSTKPNVKWLGGTSRYEMPDYYRASDVCLMSGLWREGFSMAAIEALASGLPLVASKAGFYPEILRDGYNGLLCRQEYLFEDVLTAIQRLQADRELLGRMSQNARYYAEQRLSRERVLSNYDAFLEGRYGDINDDLSIPQ